MRAAEENVKTLKDVIFFKQNHFHPNMMLTDSNTNDSIRDAGISRNSGSKEFLHYNLWDVKGCSIFCKRCFEKSFDKMLESHDELMREFIDVLNQEAEG